MGERARDQTSETLRTAVRAREAEADPSVDARTPVSVTPVFRVSDVTVDPTAMTLGDRRHGARVDPLAPTHDPTSGPVSFEPDELAGRALGHFRVDEVLGVGGMGVVYRAWDLSLERPVALKVLLGASHAARERFLREARAQAKLRHPNVVPIHYVGEDAGMTFIVMELVEGGTVADRLKQGPLPTDEALEITLGVAGALGAALESGFIHRDVKPSNILLDLHGRAMLADFGLVKGLGEIEGPPLSLRALAAGARPQADAAGLTNAGSVVGTPAYLAPEQARGEEIDHRADIFALGISLSEMASGVAPGGGRTPVSVVLQRSRGVAALPEVTGPLAGLLQRMTAADPAKRISDYADLRRALLAARSKPTSPATISTRGFAYGIDFLFYLVPGVGLAAVANLGALAFLPMILLPGAVEGYFGGRGLGKLLLGIRVQRLDGQALSLTASWARGAARSAPLLGLALPLPSVVRGLDFVVWLVAFGLALGRKHQAAHDLLVGTRVVHVLGSEAPTSKRLGPPGAAAGGGTPRP